VFDEQLRLHDQFKKKAAPQDLPKYADAVACVMFSVLHKHIRAKVALTVIFFNFHKISNN